MGYREIWIISQESLSILSLGKNILNLFRSNRSHLTIPIFVFTICFFLIPIRQFRGFELIPGDLGDARFNNYVLETIYLRLTGEVNSFWNMQMYYPYPLVGGFSDNHLGSSLFYVLPRYLLGQPDTAFQVWFLLGYALNFLSAYVAFKKLGMSTFGASVGSGIFAFAFPTSVHAIHAQLHHRWAIPMAILAISKFLKGDGLRWLGFSSLWIVIQFYIGFYTGFFTALIVGLILVIHFVISIFQSLLSRKKQQVIEKSKKRINLKSLIALISMIVISIAGMANLFYPYYQVSQLYVGFRSWDEISSMLPRPQSYLLIDDSYLWQSVAQMIQDIPQRWEHQLFVGAFPLTLFILGLVAVFKTRNRTGIDIYAAAAILVVITLSINGKSIWFYIHEVPLISAIRAVSRLDTVLLFAVSYGAAFFITWVNLNKIKLSAAILPTLILLSLLGLAEASTATIKTSEKELWRERIATLEKSIPKDLPDYAVLFFAQTGQPSMWYAHELDSMWVGLKDGKPTINGYSGQAPPNWNFFYGTDCQAVSDYITNYQAWDASNEFQSPYYLWVKSRIVPIGFTNCDTTFDLLRP